MINLTDHFTLEELSHSDTAEAKGIDNTPPAEIVSYLTELAEGLEQLRYLLGGPIHVNSGYRSPALNDAVHGVHHSAHEIGYAADFVCPAFGTPLEIVKRVQESSLEFDQVIQEGTWVHISFAPAMRKQVLTAHFAEGQPTTYAVGA